MKPHHLQLELEFGDVCFCDWRKTGGPGHKLNPYMAPGRNRTRDALVGGERSHHCAIPRNEKFHLSKILPRLFPLSLMHK